MDLHSVMTPADYAALAFFVLAAGLYSYVVERSRWAPRTLSRRMERHRAAWMSILAGREMRMVDTQIMNGLMSGTSFFASTSLIAIGAALALLNAGEQAVNIAAELPYLAHTSRSVWSTKVIGLAIIYAYAFFKFGWAYRLFNYALILVGAIPEAGKGGEGIADCQERAAGMGSCAAREFNRGLRALFLSIGYFSWFAGPYAFIGGTVLILSVLSWRQFSSEASRTVM